MPGNGKTTAGFKPEGVLPKNEGLARLREKHRQGCLSDGKTALSVSESKQMIIEGNDEHALHLRIAGISVGQRANSRIQNVLDLHLHDCSDSRCYRKDSEFSSFVGTYTRAAGNPFPKKGSSRVELIEAASHIRPGGLFIIFSHSYCGAVKEKTNFAASRAPTTNIPVMDFLLAELKPGSPQYNGIAQLQKAVSDKEFAPVRQRFGLALMHYDWDSHTISINRTVGCSGESLELLYDLAHEWQEDLNGVLLPANYLKNQTPHALAVATPDLPFSVPTILHAEPNEVFVTTGSEGDSDTLTGGLDEVDSASILYGVEHLHIGHMPFIAAGTESDIPRIKNMFETWESDVRSMSQTKEQNGRKVKVPIVEMALENRHLTISRFMYNIESGKLVELG